MYQYPYGNAQQLNLDWLMEQWQTVKQSIDGSLQGEIDRVEAAITDLLAARDAAVAAATAAGTSASAAAQSAQAAAGDAATATAQAAAATQERVNAAQFANAAQGHANAAQVQAAAAGNSANAAAASASNASASADDAYNHMISASGYANNAAASAAAAQQSFNLADAARQAAQGSASDAADSAQDAQDILDSIPEDYSELSADVVALKKTTTQQTVLSDNKVNFISPAVDSIASWMVDMYYSGAVYGAQRLVHYGKNEASGRVEYDKRLSASGAIVSGSGAFVGYIEVPEGATHVYALWRKTSTSGRSTVAWAYDENKDPISALWDNNYTAQVGYRTAALPTNTKYVCVYMGLGSSDVPRATVTVSFYMNNITVSIPEDFYGGTLDVLSGTLTQLYDSTGALLDPPIETSITSLLTFDTDTFIGENNYYIGNSTSWYSPATNRLNTIEFTEYLDNATKAIKALIAKELDEMVADTALTENDFRIVNNNLYRITAPIASGAALTPNTNCVETTISAVLKTLLS